MTTKPFSNSRRAALAAHAQCQRCQPFRACALAPVAGLDGDRQGHRRPSALRDFIAEVHT
ncbi:hypothetical protein [Variovorax sp. YR752]|uniref:hypothetical protein n=1 Tax=Variovorax sp. YR752 TaxID=1884383 RepID=UPI003137EE11